MNQLPLQQLESSRRNAALEFADDFPIFVHTLTNDGAKDPQEPQDLKITNFVAREAALLRNDISIKLRWLHIPANHMGWAEVWAFLY